MDEHLAFVPRSTADRCDAPSAGPADAAHALAPAAALQQHTQCGDAPALRFRDPPDAHDGHPTNQRHAPPAVAPNRPQRGETQ